MMVASGTAPNDTIVAGASGIGRAAICVLRLSGPASSRVVGQLLAGPLPTPRRASLRTLRDPADGSVLDYALVLWLPGPASFTGEDQAELHVHGGLAVRTAVLRALTAAGCRLAEPGEFTRRAFLNDRLDLTAVEGLADLIDAETEAQRRQAVRQLDGVMSRQASAWRAELVEQLAVLEAALDFSDEDDVPVDIDRTVSGGIATLREEVASALAGGSAGERVREGVTVVIAGPPNAGKSTLLNALARRDVAIVSPIPGTTRDVIEVRCDLAGLPVLFVDTAGLRPSDDPLEQAGMSRTRSRLAAADLVLWLDPADGDRSAPPATAAAIPIIRVATKRDLVGADDPGVVGADVAISAETGCGLPDLLGLVHAAALAATEGGGDALLTRERHRLVLLDMLACLDRVVLAGQNAAPELVAEDVRLALRALGRLTGQVDVEEVLDRIFSSFCIGK